jgi:hypothetical protein
MFTALTSTKQEMAECVSVLQRIKNKCWFDIRASMCFRNRFNAEQQMLNMMLDVDTDVDSLCQGFNESTQTIESVCVSKKVDQ